MNEKKNYQVGLYYGFQETEDGTYHAFEATDSESVVDDNMAERLAELLDTTVNDDRFDYNLMPVRLPDSLVERIKADAIKEYLEGRGEGRERVIYTHDEAAQIVEMFEDLLEAHDITVPSPEDDEKDKENGARLYGSTYSDLLDSVEEAIIGIADKARRAARIIEQVFSGEI